MKPKPTNGTASVPSRLSIRLEDRLANYAAILKQLDVVLSELEPDGLVAFDVRDKFEKLIVAERMRVANLSRTVKLAAPGPAPSPEKPSITKPNGSEKSAKTGGTGSGTQSGTLFSRP